MIFITFIILLAILADSVWCFVIPIISLFLRAAYKETNLNLIRFAPLVFVTLIFTANIFLSGKSLNENIIFSIRILIFSALLIHIINNLAKKDLASSKGIYFYIYMGMRMFSIIIERLSDTWHILTIRWKQTKFTKKPKLLLYTFSNFVLEMVSVDKQINLVNYEKGGLTNTLPSKDYSYKKAIVIPLGVSKKISISYSTIGDLACLLIILLPSTTIFNKNLFLPESILKLIQF